MTTHSDPLFSLLQPDRLTAVVDIGANPIDGETPYREMLAKRLCTVVGLEPQEYGLLELNARKSDLETYLPYAVGDGNRGVLKVCAARGMSSLLSPEPRALGCFPLFSDFGCVIGEIPVETRALDAITEIEALDFLKIDVQGAELSVFRNGSRRLSSAVAVHTEVSFVTLYKDQPAFGDIDLALRALGFIPHMLVSLNKRKIVTVLGDNRPYAPTNQLLEADFAYVRDFTKPDEMDSSQLKHLALIAHHIYRSHDLAMKCIDLLAQRACVSRDAAERYLAVTEAA
jgi:FkbM family methyltransferase